tara:strand:- start:17970 stop:18212 length:243 start_codon:yes stop_codon:yes gene_type:complete
MIVGVLVCYGNYKKLWKTPLPLFQKGILVRDKLIGVSYKCAGEISMPTSTKISLQSRKRHKKNVWARNRTTKLWRKMYPG